MEPITIVLISYSLTLTVTITSVYYIGNNLTNTIHDEIGKLRSKFHIFI